MCLCIKIPSFSMLLSVLEPPFCLGGLEMSRLVIKMLRFCP